MIKYFSIIIPTYNRGDRIADTIRSVLQQSHQNFELIVIDDGSTDNTEQIVREFEDKRISYFKKENGERAIARNFGIEKAKGDYVTFLDSDDRLYSNFLEEAEMVVQQNNLPEWFHLAYEIKDEQGKILRQENKRKGNINTSLITGNHLSCIGVFVKRDVLLSHKFNQDPNVIGSEDYLLWLELASRYPVYYTNTISAFMVQHSQRSVINFDSQQLIDRIESTISYALSSKSIKSFLEGKKGYFIAHRYLYLSNHLSRSFNKLLSFKYYILSIWNAPPIIFHRNSFSYVKSLFLLKK